MVKSLKKSLVLSCILALLLTSVASADINVSRISGRDRYETAMKVQQKYFSRASGNLAILSSGKDFRTALYGSYMANALKVPFYSIPNTGISRLMLNELKEKGVTRVNIMGNYNQLNRSIDNSLKYYGIKVNRFYIDKNNPDSLIEGWRFIIGGSSSVPSYISTYSGDTYGLNLHSWDDVKMKSYSFNGIQATSRPNCSHFW